MAVSISMLRADCDHKESEVDSKNSSNEKHLRISIQNIKNPAMDEKKDVPGKERLVFS
jgi:hypothetical protein